MSGKTRAWIRDTDLTPQHVPLQRLLAAVKSFCHADEAKLYVLRADGYGMHIRELDLRLENEERLIIDFEDLYRLSAGVEEWFYNLHAELVSADFVIRFGLHDSSFLFVEGPADIVEHVGNKFSDVTITAA